MSRRLLFTLAIAAALCLAWPTRARATPGGRFPVGTTTLHFDCKEATPPRTVTAPVWYPASAAGAKAAVAAGRFPVLLYFPGWGANINVSTSLFVALASHGFIVVAVSYPAGEGLPDAAVPMQFAPADAYTRGTAQGNRMVEIEAEDATRVLDALVQMDKRDPAGLLTGHLDTGRAGVFGYSLGGSVAAQAALHDARFRAVMNLDGWMFAEAASRFFTPPYLVINDGLAPPSAADLGSADTFTLNFSSLRDRDARHQQAQLEKSGGYRVTIAGSSHFSFSDFAKANEKNAGPIEPKHAMEIVSTFATAFFGKFLAGRPAPILGAQAVVPPEVKVEPFPLSK